MENSAVNIHEDLRSVLDYQTHHKLREAQGRAFAEDLNDRVFYWSLGQSIIVLMIGVGQVLILRSFFTEKRGSKP
jgi:protein ERP2